MSDQTITAKSGSMPSENSGRPAPPQTSPKGGKTELVNIFREGIQLPEEQQGLLQKDMEAGIQFFNQWNESRMELAFSSFDLSMKHALFEIMYLLNVNDPKYQNWKYKIFQPTGKKGGSEQEHEVDLFVEGSPYGVQAITDLSPVFKKEFETYIQDAFGESVAVPADLTNLPIEGLYSIGSIGTIGHKNIDSDLDLQVQYNLESAVFNTASWTDNVLLEKLQEVQNQLMQQHYQDSGVAKEALPPAAVKKQATRLAQQNVKTSWPLLFQHLLAKQKNIAAEIKRKKSSQLRQQLIDEIMHLMSRSPQPAAEDKEALLVSRIEKIQNYVNHKFPEAEIYLFSFSRQKLQKGEFGSTTESKESSGGAYELILNYETLFPGIYFTPVAPSHFLFSPEINNDLTLFKRYNDYLKFGLFKGTESPAVAINNQGPTPDMDPYYVVAHSAAAYWEAFKGGSGNLPKATLNLLRFEMLLESSLNKTNIQMVKNPEAIDKFILPTRSKSSKNPLDSLFTYPVSRYLLPSENEDDFIEYNDAGSEMIFPPDQMKAFEDKFPKLKQDPWWLRYKTLKIAYGRPGLVPGVPSDQIPGISDIIDLAFALHIRVSDVFTKPGDKKDFSRHREQVLVDYLAQVFPENSAQRNRLHATFIGDVQTVVDFEKELREIFQGSVDRIHEKVSTQDAQDTPADGQSSDEEQIWYHYYKKSFQAPPNVIQKSILNHLQVPRGRLQIGFKNERGWFFKSLQKGLSRGRRFESSILNLLPEEITLIEDPHFLRGLVYCVINGYYGIFNRGRLDETMTAVEYDQKHVTLGSKRDSDLAFIRPDQIERLMMTILEVFPDNKVNYLDCISKDRSIKEVMIFLNLLKFGQVSILYRDNLNTFFVDHFDIKDIHQNANIYIGSYQKMLSADGLNTVLKHFFQTKQIDPHQVDLRTWVNPNSVETTHGASQYETKEKTLSNEFKEIILQSITTLH